jgi:hypothetical protein
MLQKQAQPELALTCAENAMKPDPNLASAHWRKSSVLWVRTVIVGQNTTQAGQGSETQQPSRGLKEEADPRAFSIQKNRWQAMR